LGFVFREGEIEFYVGVDFADGFDDFVIVGGVDGEGDEIFTEIDRQFVGVRVQEQRGHVLNRKFIFDKPETDIEILLVHGVFRFDKNAGNDGNPEKTNEDKQGGLQVFVKAVYTEFDDTIRAEPDTEQEKGKGAECEKIFRRREFIGESFYVLRVFHIFIIARRKKKGKPITR
jgi:hypothetical protein